MMDEADKASSLAEELASDKVAAKALQYIANGQVRVVEVTATPEEDAYGAPGAYVTAHVTPSDGGEPYYVHRKSAGWMCDCPARVPVCAHIYATALVTPKHVGVPAKESVLSIEDIENLLKP